MYKKYKKKNSDMRTLLSLAIFIIGIFILVFTLKASGVLFAKSKNVSTEIVGGSRVPEGQYPFIAVLLDKSWEGTDFDKHFCGGSLIDPWHVLTAQHCVENYRDYVDALRVVVGRNTLTNGNGEIRNVQKITFNPEYAGNKDKDVAVLLLDAPIFSNTPISPAGPADEGYEKSGTRLAAAGWGLTEVKKKKGKKTKLGGAPNSLRKVSVPVVSDSKCQKSYHGSIDTSVTVCAGKDGKDACGGDSGGPLFSTRRDGSFVQIGIVAGGKGCGQGVPGLYTEVNAPAIANFIKAATADTPAP